MSISITKVESSDLLDKASSSCRKNFVRVKVNPSASNQYPFSSDVNYPICFLPNKYTSMADRIENFKIRSDDIWVTSFPKAGTTYLMNIVWQLMNNLDFSATFLTDEDLYFERAILVGESKDSDSDALKNMVKKLDQQLNEMDDLPSPRLLKSHLPAHLLPKNIWNAKPKLLYIYRDAKDVAISMYHMYRNHSRVQFTGTLEDYLDAFLNDYVTFGPFYEHIRSYQQLTGFENILFLSYDDMISNPFTGVKRISEFLERKYDDDQLKQLVKHVSFENMRKNVNVNLNVYPSGFNFFRKGKSGGFRDEMSPEYILKFDEWKKEQEKKCAILFK